jgi:xanthine dehydrogenase small subunit
MAIQFHLNDRPVVATPDDPHQSLLEWLRQSGLTGAKEGCAEGECGTCAVAVLRAGRSGEAEYQSINSCLLPLASLHGQRVLSVEGIAEPDGRLHPVQAAMVQGAGSQCGYCTPGFVVSLFCEYLRPGRDEYDPEGISGNLCRCTGYRPIVDVAKALPPVTQPVAQPQQIETPPSQVAPVQVPSAQAPADRHLLQLRAPLAPLGNLSYTAGGRRFLRPTSLADALASAQQYPEASWLAGGTDLMVYRNQRGTAWPALISLDAVEELKEFRVEPQQIVIGAGVNLSRLETLVHAQPELALLAQLLPLFSSRLIRNRATLGGNLGTASPIGDGPPVLLALDAQITLASSSGLRQLALKDYFLGYRETALAPGELIVSVQLPLPLPRWQRFYKVSKRSLDDISSVACAFGLDVDPTGQVTRLRVACGGVAATPLRALQIEHAALGRAWDRETCEWLSSELQGLGTPQDVHRASAAYRRVMLGKLAEKFVEETRTMKGEAA